MPFYIFLKDNEKTFLEFESGSYALNSGFNTLIQNFVTIENGVTQTKKNTLCNLGVVFVNLTAFSHSKVVMHYTLSEISTH